MIVDKTIHDARCPMETVRAIGKALELEHRHLQARVGDTGKAYLTVSDYCDAPAPALVGLRAGESHLIEHGDSVWVYRGIVRHLPHRFVVDPELRITLDYEPARAASAVVLIAETLARTQGSRRRPPEVSGSMRGDTLIIRYRGRRIGRLRPGTRLIADAFRIRARQIKDRT